MSTRKYYQDIFRHIVINFPALQKQVVIKSITHRRKIDQRNGNILRKRRCNLVQNFNIIQKRYGGAASAQLTKIYAVLFSLPFT
jgi:hypothetical protein